LEFFRIPNHISIAALVIPRDLRGRDYRTPSGPLRPRSLGDDTPQLLGGVDIDVVAARATRFGLFEIIGGSGERLVKGRVETVDDSSPIPDGKVLLIDSPTPQWWPRQIGLKYPPVLSPMETNKRRRPQKTRYREVQIIGGEFEVKAPVSRALRAYYGGGDGYGECHSKTISAPE
jgi:hypothetical protein